MLVRSVLTCAVLVFGLQAAAAQQEMADVEIRTMSVADGLYVLFGRGGNIGLSVGDDGPFVIDDQFAPLTEKILAAIAEVTDRDVRFVLNTHWHGDHTGGNENFGEAGALIVAHENVRRRMSVEQLRGQDTTPPAPAGALPVVTFLEAVTFHWNGDQIRAVHVGHAHTDGDAIIFFERANVVHMGDTFFNGRYPFIDVASGGGVDGVIAAAEMTLSMINSQTRIIPGHGEVATATELRAYRDMLVTARDRIRLLKNDGMTVDQVVRARPTADLDAVWGQNPESFVRNVYQGMTNER